MGKIIAIGGGFAKKINDEIIKISGKKSPKTLFIPTASNDNEEYIQIFSTYFQKHYGVEVKILRLFTKKDRPSTKDIENLILTSDIIYVGGGNTLAMMNIWRSLGVDKMLKKAFEKNIVLCGASAGSICWFDYGNSDSWKYYNKKAPYIRVKGLGLLPFLHCPHYHGERIYCRGRVKSLQKMVKSKETAIALDDDVALESIDGKYRIIEAAKDAHAYKVYRKNGEVVKERVENGKIFD